MVDVHLIYTLLHDGALFRFLSGKKVAIVGNKAEAFFRYFYKDQTYRQTFPFLNLDQVDIVKVVRTPDYPEYCMDYLSLIREETRQSYQSDIDAYLFSCGIAAKYLSSMVHQESGRIGWDIGSALDMLMGLRKDRGWMCGPFLDYRHPTIDLILESASKD